VTGLQKQHLTGRSGLQNKRILCTIVNYDRNENARKLRNSFSGYFSTIVIDSGSPVKDPSFINLPNVYYSGLYNYAYNTALTNGYQFLLFICSDVIFEEPEVKKMIDCLTTIDLDKVGIYSPSSSGRSHYQCKKTNSSGLRSVDFAEGFMFLANMELLKIISLIDTEKNLFGWGIDVIQGYYAKTMKLLCLIDDRVSVFHPEETGYPIDNAEEQMYNWFNSFPEGEEITSFHLHRVNRIRKGIETNFKISVIVPCYNQVAWLEEAILSVFSQTYSNFEILIINDGSTDDTAIIGKRLEDTFSQVKYIFQENGGLSAARNCGLDHATGDMIQFLDADDILSVNKFNYAVERFIESDETGIVYSNYLCFEDRNREKTWTYSRVTLEGDPVLDIIAHWETELSIPIHCFIFKKDIIGDSRFDTSLPNHEDWEFHLDIASKRPNYLFDPESTAYYRIKSVAMSQNKEMMKKGKNWCIANMIASNKFANSHLEQLYKRFDHHILIGIVSCRKQMNRINTIRTGWVKELKRYGIDYFFIVGDPLISDYILENDILYMPCSDNYESLPQKVLSFYKYALERTPFDFVYKIDDDCYLNAENVYSTLFWNYDYVGKIVATDEKALQRDWHFGKCTDPEINRTFYGGEYIGPWCGGGFGYFLSRRSLSTISSMSEFITHELYEDKAIGDALRMNNIFPQENPLYKILDITTFDINHNSETEFNKLLEYIGGRLLEYLAIIELNRDYKLISIQSAKDRIFNHENVTPPSDIVFRIILNFRSKIKSIISMILNLLVQFKKKLLSKFGN